MPGLLIRVSSLQVTSRIKAKASQTLQSVLSQKTPSHKAMMRNDWMAKATKLATLGSILSLALIPEFANAALDFSGLKSMAKDFVSFLIFDVGFRSISFTGHASTRHSLAAIRFGGKRNPVVSVLQDGK